MELNRDNTIKMANILFSERLNLHRSEKSILNSSKNKVDTLRDQLLDSAIVSGITGISTFIYAGGDASLKSTILSFILTFLIKMKEYRKIH
jgi:hypothetical protein